MLKLISLGGGILIATIAAPNSQAAIFQNQLPLARSEGEFHAQVVNPLKKLDSSKKPAIKKTIIKAPIYREIKLPEITKDKINCETVTNRGRIGTSENMDSSNPYRGYSVGVSGDFNDLSRQKCTAEKTLPTPNPQVK
jgi:hypothetical protein